MGAIYLLIPLAILIIAVAIGLFFWAVDNGQFEDLDKEAHRILFDDDKDKIPPAPFQTKKQRK